MINPRESGPGTYSLQLASHSLPASGARVAFGGVASKEESVMRGTQHSLSARQAKKIVLTMLVRFPWVNTGPHVGKVYRAGHCDLIRDQKCLAVEMSDGDLRLIIEDAVEVIAGDGD